GAYGLKKEGYRNDESDLPDGMPSIVTVEVPVRDERYGFHTVYLAYLYWNPNESSGGYMEGIQVAQDYQGVTVRTTVPDGVLKWQDSAGNAYTMPLEFWFEADSAGIPCCYSNFSLQFDTAGLFLQLCADPAVGGYTKMTQFYRTMILCGRNFGHLSHSQGLPQFSSLYQNESFMTT
ncbi:hypothetical protein, partial [Oscillibacter sp.]